MFARACGNRCCDRLPCDRYGKVTWAKGCAINSQDTTGFAAAIAAVGQADISVFVGGLDQSQECVVT